MTPEDPTKFIENLGYIQRARWPRFVTPEIVEAVLLFDHDISPWIIEPDDDDDPADADDLAYSLLNYLEDQYKMVMPDSERHGVCPAWYKEDGEKVHEIIGEFIKERQSWDADKLEDRRHAFLCRWGLR